MRLPLFFMQQELWDQFSLLWCHENVIHSSPSRYKCCSFCEQWLCGGSFVCWTESFDCKFIIYRQDTWGEKQKLVSEDFSAPLLPTDSSASRRLPHVNYGLSPTFSSQDTQHTLRFVCSLVWQQRWGSRCCRAVWVRSMPSTGSHTQQKSPASFPKWSKSEQCLAI